MKKPLNNLVTLGASEAMDVGNPKLESTGFVTQLEAIALQADGKILAGGNFTGPSSIGGQSRNFIAGLDPTTGAADSFDPSANSTVSRMVGGRSCRAQFVL